MCNDTFCTGIDSGPVNYFMMCDPKYANDLGEIVQ
jgi:hypothetical protein